MSQNLIGGYELVAMEECSLPEQVAAGNKKTIRGGKHLKKLTFLFALLLCAALSGCNQPAAPQGGDPSDVVSTPPAAESDPPTTAPADEQTVTLYIGTKAGGFAEYPITYEGELTPELLIQGVADLTGWDLTLAHCLPAGRGIDRRGILKCVDCGGCCPSGRFALPAVPARRQGVRRRGHPQRHGGKGVSLWHGF